MDEDDSYIFCGTALPDPEDGPSAQKRAHRELQVRDEKGRQRFHGAFTGGFSAGYFNTVSTKEGWTPSTFVSSRSKTAKRMEQHPEDFMDAEDFSEFGIAPKKIHTTAKFRDGTTSGKRKAPVYSDTVIPGEPPLKELVQPIAENIGIQILMKMGWKPGQGIGPRVKRSSRKRMSQVDEISASDDVLLEADDPMTASFTFAPKDTTSFPYTPKDDYHGIGYTGLSTKSVLSATSSGTSDVTKSWLEKSKKKLLISGKAFGIGALEDDDDIDIYSHEDMSQYDFSEFGTNQKETKEAGRSIRESKDGFDGVLDGFVKSDKTLTVRKRFPLPQLPAGYTPVRKSVHTSGGSESTASKHQVLTAEDRSLILGERKLITMAFKNASPSTSKNSTSGEQRHNASVKAVSSGFQPFINDPEKQKRYEEYLKLERKEHIKNLQPIHMTEWEKQQELEEFTRAASLYQPLSNMLSSRFVSKTHLAAESQGGIVKVEKSSPERVMPSGPSHEKTEWHPASLLCKRFNIPNPYPSSSSIGVPSSGRKQKFLFDCLSFEDNNKQTTAAEVEIVHQEEKAMPSVKIEVEDSQGPDVEDPKIEKLLASAPEEIAPGVSKPPMDLFKAIFENSSDEEEQDSSHSDHSDGEAEKEASSSSKDPVPSPANEQDNVPAPAPLANSKPPKKAFGVFANIDFDMLNKSRVLPSDMSVTSCDNANVSTQSADAAMNQNPISEETTRKQQLEEVSTMPSSNVYGPQLPPPNFGSSYSETKTHPHKHSRHKEKHKNHKHKKKKKKKKHKKQKKRSSVKDSAESSSIDSGSSDDDDDIDPSVIIKRLNDLHNKSSKKYCKY